MNDFRQPANIRIQYQPNTSTTLVKKSTVVYRNCILDVHKLFSLGMRFVNRNNNNCTEIFNTPISIVFYFQPSVTVSLHNRERINNRSQALPKQDEIADRRRILHMYTYTFMQLD